MLERLRRGRAALHEENQGQGKKTTEMVAAQPRVSRVDGCCRRGCGVSRARAGAVTAVTLPLSCLIIAVARRQQ